MFDATFRSLKLTVWTPLNGVREVGEDLSSLKVQYIAI